MCHRVLFVDDEKSVLQSIFRNLSFHLDITTAYSAKDGLALLSGPGEFDVVVTDINMPGLSGLEFVRLAQDIDPHIPFIILSGCGDEATLREAKENPAINQFLAKPSGWQSIMEAVERAIERAPMPA